MDSLLSLRQTGEAAADLWRQNDLVTEVRIELDEIKDMAVSMDFAIPVGLAFNELVSNVSEHGYPDATDKPVTLRAERADEQITSGDAGCV
ncbi:MAG: ATP-binding protein [Alkalispirochaeta sp.]